MIPHPSRTPSGHRKPRDSGDLASLVSQFRDTTVLVIGDIILDRYVVGDVHRLSPEAPIPVLRPPGRRRQRRAEHRQPWRPRLARRCSWLR